MGRVTASQHKGVWRQEVVEIVANLCINHTISPVCPSFIHSFMHAFIHCTLEHPLGSQHLPDMGHRGDLVLMGPRDWWGRQMNKPICATKLQGMSIYFIDLSLHRTFFHKVWNQPAKKRHKQ